MLSFLPAPLIFIINMVMISIASILLSVPLIILALVKLILPFKPVLSFVDAYGQVAFRCFCAHNAGLMRITTNVDWDIKGLENLKVKGSCIVISNHLSWTDIVMLCHIYRYRIPITKFFLKQSLIFIPVIGQACYAVGMPFLRRYTRAQILKNPKLKTRDLDATRKACKSLLVYPSSLVNFVEGTRFTPEKARAQKSPYQNLMPPKAASLAVALGMIGNNIDCMINTTLLYPGAKEGSSVFYQLLCGRLKKVIARVEIIDRETIQSRMVGDYMTDRQFKRSFTNELRQIWQRKDEQIAQLLGKEYVRPDWSEPSRSAPEPAKVPSAPAADAAAASDHESAPASAAAQAADAAPAANAAPAGADAQAKPEPESAMVDSAADSKQKETAAP